MENKKKNIRNFNCFEFFQNSNFTIFDYDGNIVQKGVITNEPPDVSKIKTGEYILIFDFDESLITKRIIIN